MRLFFLTILFLGIQTASTAQPLPPTIDGLFAYYSFDNCDATDDTGGGSDGILMGSPNCVCGVSGNALELDGLNDYVLFLGAVNNIFDVDNISISFYFKPFGSPLKQSILTKRENCGPDNVLNIEFTPANNTVSAEMSENNGKSSNAVSVMDFSNCWHHVLIVRRGGRTLLYLDGILEQEATAISRIDLENSAPLALADSPCIGSGVNRFKGYIDELAIYNIDLIEDEALENYLNPDQIINENTTVFLGESVQIETTASCASSFSWIPSTGVDDPTSANPNISPTESTTYRLNFIDDNGCTAYDTIRIQVIDPSLLDCSEVFLPKAFTPNGDGPTKNETFGISSWRSMEELVSFEIFDRWGERVFQTTIASETWDGNFGGQALNPGVFLYKLEFKCNGETQQQFGSLSLIR